MIPTKDHQHIDGNGRGSVFQAPFCPGLSCHGRKLKDEEEASVVVVEKVVVVECPRGARQAGARQFRFGSSATTASVRTWRERWQDNAVCVSGACFQAVSQPVTLSYS